eukprot:991851-Rhodomonas_salina.1
MALVKEAIINAAVRSDGVVIKTAAERAPVRPDSARTNAGAVVSCTNLSLKTPEAPFHSAVGSNTAFPVMGRVVVCTFVPTKPDTSTTSPGSRDAYIVTAP